jgi:hypothetical protein
MGGDFKCLRGYGIEVGDDWMGGIGCVAGEPSALAMWVDWGGRYCFLFKGYFA